MTEKMNLSDKKWVVLFFFISGVSFFYEKCMTAGLNVVY
ncbi:hypothetical protein EVA_17961 [gut metagenome]|uniref:Uncharacterized protein n=1 Tax=gut metagenome TaxID=749906 RepID=J9FWJ3_9ZZZZ